ncbi:HAMP domain-containing sensor histidine kinase [Clostridium grantii]|nr:HAMP domain-containing sensor histidine kinase [Clostridium grantii]
MSNNILYPIKDMTYIVKDISVNHLDTRINIAGTKDELKELATTFNQMLDRLEKSYEQQNRFVSDASHELRTPIAVIQGYINLLDRWGKNDEDVLNESIEAIKSESQSMKELVEKLLFLARADKNTQKIEKNIFSLRSLIDQVTKETKLIDKNHLITNLVNEDIFYWGDEKLIKQTLRIFIDNSIKFTNDGGKITINSFKEINTICIEIEDTGMGIDKDDISKIFDRFYTTDKSRSKEYSGNGLGLSIAKWIISQHKGSIQVSSKLNFGTKIKIILPIL